MVEKLADNLYKKGWKKEEVLETLDLVKQAKKNKHPHSIFLDKCIYWTLLVVVFVLNFGVATAFLPSMLSFNWPFLYFMLIIIGFVFGLIIELVIRSIEHLESHHHISLSIIIPIIAIFNIVFIGTNSNKVHDSLNFGFSHNLYLVGIIYSFFLILPYLVFKFIMKKGYYSKPIF